MPAGAVVLTKTLGQEMRPSGRGQSQYGPVEVSGMLCEPWASDSLFERLARLVSEVDAIDSLMQDGGFRLRDGCRFKWMHCVRQGVGCQSG